MARIIDIHRVHALKPITTFGARSRGRQGPMFRSGGSKSLLPRHQQRQIYLTHVEDILSNHMGGTWEEFRVQLDQIKKSGFYMF